MNASLITESDTGESYTSSSSSSESLGSPDSELIVNDGFVAGFTPSMASISSKILHDFLFRPVSLLLSITFL